MTPATIDSARSPSRMANGFQMIPRDGAYLIADAVTRPQMPPSPTETAIVCIGETRSLAGVTAFFDALR